MDTYGYWEMTVTGPPQALNEMGAPTVMVKGSRRGKSDEQNLIFAAGEAVAELVGKAYDDFPDTWCPLEFSEPELTTNQWVAPDGGQQWFVGVFTIDRAYGGPEEGGWWFDCGELVQQTAVNSESEAEALRIRLRDEFPDTGASSRVHGGEDYRIAINIDPHPQSYPETMPRYE